MSGPFGVTPTGFTAPTEEELLALIEADQHADISATLDVSESSVLGKINRVFARRFKAAWDSLEQIYHGFDPDKATADQLTSLLKITGTQRQGASRSEVPVVVRLKAATKLEAEKHFAHVTDRPDLRWTPKADFTAPTDGDFSLRFRAEQTGPIDTPEDSITAIATPLVGWVAIVSSGEVAVGHEADDDAAARARREQQLATFGSATVAGVRSDLLKLDSATACTVFENTSDQTDANGMPPHSIEAIIAADDASDDEIAQALFDTKAAGITTVGSSSGTAFDADGEPHEVRFSRPQQIPVWISYGIQRLDGYVSDDVFKATVASLLDALTGPGYNLVDYDCWSVTHGLGIRGRSVTFGLSANPTNEDAIQFGPREVPRFDAGRITLT
ncbi:MAG TPA: hypothetical protein VHB79_38830 [Polyangiaceae bacterium]|nr:hypothetical protein [Polyangiaceae bacterium]